MLSVIFSGVEWKEINEEKEKEKSKNCSKLSNLVFDVEKWEH